MAIGRNDTGLVLTMVLVAALCAGAAAQSSCTNVLMSLSPCLNYITGNSSVPTSGCCNQLSGVVNSQPQCLCQVLSGGGSSLGINVNQTQAMALPAACKIQTPPVSRCNGAASPSGSPAGDKPGSADKIPSGRGSNTVPATEGDGSSDASSSKLSNSLIFFLLFASSYASTFMMC